MPVRAFCLATLGWIDVSGKIYSLEEVAILQVKFNMFLQSPFLTRQRTTSKSVSFYISFLGSMHMSLSSKQVSRSSALDALHITCRVYIAWNDTAQMPFTYSKVAHQLHRAHIHFSIGLPHELETPHSSVWSNVAEGLTHPHMSSSMSSVCTSLDDLSPNSGSV
jgi:hypothetical protein